MPQPGTSHPISIGFSADDRVLTFLMSSPGAMTRQVWGMDLPSAGAPAFDEPARQLVFPPNEGNTEDNLSLEEKLRRERQRLHAVGVTSYAWSGRASAKARILVPLQGNVYVQDGADSGTALRLVYDRATLGGGAIDLQLSPDGSMVAFVVNGELYCAAAEDALTSMGPVQLTEGARENGMSNGLADYVAQEEMDRYHGFWWSNDSSRIAFTQVRFGLRSGQTLDPIPTRRMKHQKLHMCDFWCLGSVFASQGYFIPTPTHTNSAGR